MMMHMFRSCLCACLALAASVSSLSAYAQQQPTLLVDVDHRPQQSLDGPWHYIVDPFRNGWGSNTAEAGPNGYARNGHYVPGGPLVEYDFAKLPTLTVPGDWNTQDPKLLYYEGLLWYQRDFDLQKQPGARVYLHFGAVNYAAQVFVNDVHVCDHEGGYTPFDCDITQAAKDGSNFVVVAVDNMRMPDRIPAMKFDWWNYGGITRDVSIVQVPEKFIDDYSLQLDRGADAPTISGYVHVESGEAGMPVRVSIPDLKVDSTAMTDASGRAAFRFPAKELERWSPEHPRLYHVEMQAAEDHLADDIGFRTVSVEGDKILLNGKPVFLRGIDIHAEAPYRGGRAWSEKDVATLLGWAGELHCNFVRLAHYPHDERMTRLADKMGIMVWSEIPVYWGNDWTNPKTAAVAGQQLHEMIRRDHNNASVIMWSLSNETPGSEARTEFIHHLADEARAQDPTRLITSAIVTHFEGKTAVLDDPLGKFLDVLGYNEYIGWYMGTPETIPDYQWKDPLGKPVIISEFGAGAKAGLHGSPDMRFAEEYQRNVYEKQFEMFSHIPFLAGITPWVLMDFRSPLRQLPGVQDGFNRKGLVSNDGQKKEAFYALQKYYEQKEKEAQH